MHHHIHITTKTPQMIASLVLNSFTEFVIAFAMT